MIVMSRSNDIVTIIIEKYKNILMRIFKAIVTRRL